jgi:hypothetical protein
MPGHPGVAAGMIQAGTPRAYNHSGRAAGMIQTGITHVLFGRKLPPALIRPGTAYFESRINQRPDTDAVVSSHLGGEEAPSSGLSKAVHEGPCSAEPTHGTEMAVQPSLVLELELEIEPPTADTDCSDDHEHESLLRALTRNADLLFGSKMQEYFSDVVQEVHATTRRQMARWDQENLLKEKKNAK